MKRVTSLIPAVALFMEQMDATVIATSLPAIAADIGTEPVALKLALTAYLVALAIFLPVSGWMGDRYGARNIFRLAIVVFMLGSVGCAFANSLETFVASRFFEGMGASMMTPLARLLLVRSTPRSELVNAMAWMTIPALIGPIAGPPIGGFLTTYLSWHWIFFINIPIGIAGIVLATIYFPKEDTRTPRPIDVTGFVLTSLAFSGLVLGLSIASLPAVPIVYGYLTFAVGITATLLYIFHARRTKYPLLDPSVLNVGTFRAAVVSGSLFRLGFGATAFVLPLMLQLTMGYSPFEAGLVTAVAAIGALVSKFLAERVFKTFGFPRTLTLTAVVGSLFLAAHALFGPETATWIICVNLIFSGLVRSIFFTGVNALAYADVENADASQATTLNAVFQQLAVAFGVALAGGVLQVSAAFHGGEMALSDYHLTFLVIAGISVIAAFFTVRLPPDAGREVSGHQRIVLDKE